MYLLYTNLFLYLYFYINNNIETFNSLILFYKEIFTINECVPKQQMNSLFVRNF